MNDVPQPLASALADRYLLEREVGAGGMATVYLARDLRHKRSVAVKVIRPELAGQGGVERFLREIELVAGLQHPHILPVFDSGVVQVGDGAPVPYFVMPFVEGAFMLAWYIWETASHHLGDSVLGKHETKSGKTGPARIVHYIQLYQHVLRALISSVERAGITPVSHVAAVGLTEVWPCRDGAVALVYTRKGGEIEVVEKPATGVTINRFLLEHPTMRYYNNRGNPTSLQPFIELEDASTGIMHFADLLLEDGERTYRPLFARGSVFGWDAPLPEPDSEALNDFRAAFAERNIVGAESASMPEEEARRLAYHGAQDLLRHFRQLLVNARKEEELQQFVRDHPQVLYPDYIDVIPKFKLGSEYVTDFLMIVQSQQGLEHVFIELEHPEKRIFVQSGQFGTDFTQAKDQLLNWEAWITKNHAYISQKHPSLNKPLFHLVLGRSSDLSQEQRDKLQNEFMATNRRFSTYDDLAERFEKVTERLLGAA
jgi:hypothetical protein